MASEIHMPSPVCLIENVKGQLTANQEALGILSAIKQPVVVVAIVGLYRTGKSYLMNKLAGKNTGFSLGSTVQSHTKGIWMWCVSHPQKPGHTLVLLDTEGLGDVEKGDNQNDCWIFALAILLSGTFVYNSMGAINQQALDQLHYVTELTHRIRARSSPGARENSGEFVRFFPDFVWTLRDFSLELKVDGKSVTADEYLANSLKLISGNSEKEKNLNQARHCICTFFPKKKCFVFERPTLGKNLNRLESLQDDDLDSDFLGQVKEFCSYIFTCAETKTLSGGIKVNGPRLQNLVETYVKSISSGNLPCVENAVTTLSMKENSAAVETALALYDQQMSQKVQLPTETLQELMDLHRTCEKEAIKVFIKNSFNDIDQLFQGKLETKLEMKRKEFFKKNVQASSDRCSALLQNVFSPLEEDMKQGVYSKPGGYRLLIQNIQELKKKYREEPRKGIQAEEALEKFLQSKESEIDGILRTDEALTAREKEKEVERMKAEAAQARENLLKEMQMKNEQLLSEKERSHQKNMKQLRKMIQKEEAQKREEQGRVMEHKFEEQLRLLKEGFKEESKKLQDEINNLQKRTHDCVIS